MLAAIAAGWFCGGGDLGGDGGCCLPLPEATGLFPLWEFLLDLPPLGDPLGDLPGFALPLAVVFLFPFPSVSVCGVLVLVGWEERVIGFLSCFPVIDSGEKMKHGTSSGSLGVSSDGPALGSSLGSSSSEEFAQDSLCLRSSSGRSSGKTDFFGGVSSCLGGSLSSIGL